ncbi:protein DEHYDRATION-INDUCED 19-like isoform X1 [Diospyros lotus]|uniref:protein DEHYDRATION-INDUCED 19-like isoform X1 n=1 Tax=Diospyros lotus TaxID=55363 RepID=UPI002258FBB1|nr:protein DEHYDRATION-INDUCED 19-like isoform X1 [Diospyros lotus]
MDSDFWASRLAAAKRQFTLQNHHQHHGFQLDRLNFDEFEVEDEVRPDFPYPHSYEDFDLASLYSHLEDEQHACESKVAVCPICSVKVVTDMLSHITLQHGHLFKLQRRRRLRRVAIPNSQALSLLGRDLREAHLQMLLGGGGYHSSNANSSANAVTTDPFLSSLILKFPTSESEDISKSVASGAEESSTKSATSSHLWKTSFDPSLSSEEREKRMRQAAGRAGFLQDLLVSTLLGD